MRVLLAYPGPLYSTYDVAQGYEKAFRRLGVIVHSYDYHGYVHFYTRSLEHWQTVNTEYEYRAEDALYYASQHLIPSVLDFQPEVVLVVGGVTIHKRAYDLLHILNVPVVILLTESPYEDDKQALVLEQAHVVGAFTNEMYSVERLNAIVPTVYLPHSYDPDVHHPRRRVGAEYSSSVFFHGTMWREREELFCGLTGIQGARIGGIEPYAVNNPKQVLPNVEVARYYCGTQIALNHHRYAGEAYSLNPRAYEISACGAFQLCDGSREELRKVFGAAVPTYTDAEDLKDKVDYYLAHRAGRERWGSLARGRVQGCTFESRAREIVLPHLEEVINNGRW